MLVESSENTTIIGALAAVWGHLPVESTAPFRHFLFLERDGNAPQSCPSTPSHNHVPSSLQQPPLHLITPHKHPSHARTLLSDQGTSAKYAHADAACTPWDACLYVAPYPSSVQPAPHGLSKRVSPGQSKLCATGLGRALRNTRNPHPAALSPPAPPPPLRRAHSKWLCMDSLTSWSSITRSIISQTCPAQPRLPSLPGTGGEGKSTPAHSKWLCMTP
jgi:hypothetical protein